MRTELPPGWRRIRNNDNAKPEFHGPELSAVDADDAWWTAQEQAVKVLGLTYQELNAIMDARK